MSAETFRVFRHGKGTRVFYSTEKRITTPGQGAFLDRTFAEFREAQEFCRAEIAKDHNAILYVMRGDLIVETLLDPDHQRARERRIRITGGLVSVIPIALVSLLLFLTMAPFASRSANLALAGGMVLVYLSILWGENWNIVDSMVQIVIFLVLAGILIGGIKKARARREKRNQPAASLLHPASIRPVARMSNSIRADS